MEEDGRLKQICKDEFVLWRQVMIERDLPREYTKTKLLRDVHMTV